MATLNDAISTADTNTIAAIHSPTTKRTASVSVVPSPASDQRTHNIEALHLDEGDVNARTKIRTLAIVLALYVVLFIAALDQTIIA